MSHDDDRFFWGEKEGRAAICDREICETWDSSKPKGYILGNKADNQQLLNLLNDMDRQIKRLQEGVTEVKELDFDPDLEIGS